mmetsp:Transcript_6050/g.10087  ORF Transcript_6050/g.10087 Transcript_6050/m.10087 type:complete len:267 (-) Transcript_6050:869-1669(-)
MCWICCMALSNPPFREASNKAYLAIDLRCSSDGFSSSSTTLRCFNTLSMPPFWKACIKASCAFFLMFSISRAFLTFSMAAARVFSFTAFIKVECAFFRRFSLSRFSRFLATLSMTSARRPFAAAWERVVRACCLTAAISSALFASSAALAKPPFRATLRSASRALILSSRTSAFFSSSAAFALAKPFMRASRALTFNSSISATFFRCLMLSSFSASFPLSAACARAFIAFSLNALMSAASSSAFFSALLFFNFIKMASRPPFSTPF